jgi:putative methyltransferase (TIGR04325 family)
VIKHIWEGIYSGFSEVPVAGGGHEGATWTARSLEKIRGLLLLRQRGAIPRVPEYNSSLLPLLSAVVLAARGKVTVLDFGGGLGFTYIPVLEALADDPSISYHIVETHSICEAGKEVFADDPRIQFHSTLPASVARVDIVHFGSSLQYIDDWRGLIRDCCGYRPAYLMITDLTAGDIPSYVTAQNYYEAKIPARFFNIDELCDTMRASGFPLIFRSRFKGTYFGKAQELPQENFPERFRLGDTCSLVFGSK